MTAGELVVLASVVTAGCVLGVLHSVVADATPKAPPAITAVLSQDHKTLRCTVQPDARNRALAAGITGFWQSERQLDPMDSQKTFPFPIPTIVGCDQGDVLQLYCIVARSDRTYATAMTQFMCQ